MDLQEVLKRPVITEKSTTLHGMGKYAFKVSDRASKAQIKSAVEKAFNVKVTMVNVMTTPSKTKLLGTRRIRTSSWKKAIVTLQKGDKIEFFEGV